MANTTRLKPRRVNSFNEPSEGKNLGYKNDDQFKWQDGGPSEGYIKYEDYEWNTLTGSSLTIEKISNNITPSSDFTVSSGTVKPGMEYILRISSGDTPYTMTLGTGVTNPNGYKTELEPNAVNQFRFIAISTNQLELEGVDSASTGKQSYFKTQAEYDALPASKESDGNLYIIVDTHINFMPFTELTQLTPAPDAILAELNKAPKDYAEYYYENGDIQMLEMSSSQLPRADAYLKNYGFSIGNNEYDWVDTNLTEQELSNMGAPQEIIETMLSGEWVFI